MINNVLALRSVIERAAGILEIPLPDPVAKAFAEADTLASECNALINSHEVFCSAVIEAVRAGKDPNNDKEVQRALLGYSLGGQFTERSRAEAGYIVKDALMLFVDVILESWRKALEPDAAALLLAVDVLPTHDLDDTRSVVNAGSDVLKAWTGAVEAVERFNHATDGFAALAAITGRESRNTLAVLAAVDAAGIARIQSTAAAAGRSPNVWDVACSGFHPSLPTFVEWRRRHDALAAERARQKATATEAREHIGARPGFVKVPK